MSHRSTRHKAHHLEILWEYVFAQLSLGKFDLSEFSEYTTKQGKKHKPHTVEIESQAYRNKKPQSKLRSSHIRPLVNAICILLEWIIHLLPSMLFSFSASLLFLWGVLRSWIVVSAFLVINIKVFVNSGFVPFPAHLFILLCWWHWVDIL